MADTSPVNKAELIKLYSESLPDDSRSKYTAVVRSFLSHTTRLDKQGVSSYLDKLRKAGYADGTIDWQFRVLSRFFRVAGIPWPFRRGEGPGIREMEVRKPALSLDLVAQLIDAAKAGQLDPEVSCYLALSTVYGMRREELSRTDSGRFSLTQGLIYVETAKHGRQRYHAVPEEVLPYLEKAAPDLQRASVSYMSAAYHRAEKAAGIQHIPETGWHAIRRSLVHYLIENGANQFAVTNFLRWKRSSTDMAARYHNVTLVGGAEQEVGLAASDRAQDMEIFKLHPFLPFWRS